MEFTFRWSHPCPPCFFSFSSPSSLSPGPRVASSSPPWTRRPQRTMRWECQHLWSTRWPGRYLVQRWAPRVTVLKILTCALVSTWSLVSSNWEHVKRKMHPWTMPIQPVNRICARHHPLHPFQSNTESYYCELSLRLKLKVKVPSTPFSFFANRASNFVLRNLSAYEIAHSCPKYHLCCCWWWWRLWWSC